MPLSTIVESITEIFKPMCVDKEEEHSLLVRERLDSAAVDVWIGDKVMELDYQSAQFIRDSKDPGRAIFKLCENPLPKEGLVFMNLLHAAGFTKQFYAEFMQLFYKEFPGVMPGYVIEFTHGQQCLRAKEARKFILKQLKPREALL